MFGISRLNSELAYWNLAIGIIYCRDKNLNALHTPCPAPIAESVTEGGEAVLIDD